MPNIRAQRIDNTGIYIQASDGTELSVTRQQIRQAWLKTGQDHPGWTRAQRKLAIRRFLRRRIRDTFGEHLFGGDDPDDANDTIQFDFDDQAEDGGTLDLSFTSP